MSKTIWENFEFLTEFDFRAQDLELRIYIFETLKQDLYIVDQ
jgi:hypothetical protein